MKEQKTIWVTSAGCLAGFMAAKDEIKPSFTNLCNPELDMEVHQWVKVGTATVEYTFNLSDEVYSSAISAVDTKIEELQTEHRQKLNALREFRSTLLALPSPTITPTPEPEDDLPF